MHTASKVDPAKLRTFSQRGELSELCGVRGCGGTLHFYTEGGYTRSTCNRCEMRVLLIERLAKTFQIGDPTRFLQLARPEFKRRIIERVVERPVHATGEPLSRREASLARAKTPGAAATYAYKPKPCAHCHRQFTPKSGRNIYCPDHDTPKKRDADRATHHAPDAGAVGAR